MIEVELKAVVPDLRALLDRLRQLGAREQVVGHLHDRRLDTADNTLDARDEVLRLRIYDSPSDPPRISLDWKGRSSVVRGYKQREELSVDIVASDPTTAMTIFAKLGLRTSMSIDREIWQFSLGGAMIRVERYPRMDDLVEIEGEPAAIESVIARLGLDRSTFKSDSLPVFAARFEARTGMEARLATGDPNEPPTTTPYNV